jgi:hypothetical protein
LLTTLFGITGHLTASIARMPSPLPKHYSIPKTSFLINAEVGTIPHNRLFSTRSPTARSNGQPGFSQRDADRGCQ